MSDSDHDEASPVFDRPTCQSRRCGARPQKLVEIEIAGGESDVLGLCMVHTFVVISRDVGEQVEVIWP